MWLITCCANGQSFFVFVLYGMRKNVYRQWRNALKTAFKSARGSSTVISGRAVSSHRRNSSGVKETSVHEVKSAAIAPNASADVEQAGKAFRVESTASPNPKEDLVQAGAARSNSTTATPFN
jgi:hypothetical protein